MHKRSRVLCGAVPSIAIREHVDWSSFAVVGRPVGLDFRVSTHGIETESVDDVRCPDALFVR